MCVSKEVESQVSSSLDSSGDVLPPAKVPRLEGECTIHSQPELGSRYSKT